MRQDRERGERGPGAAGEPGSSGQYRPGYEGPLPAVGAELSGTSGPPGKVGGSVRAGGRTGPDEAELFEWGGGYVGGRGYGGTNYDLDHGYAVRGAGPRGRRASTSARGTSRGGGGSTWAEPEPTDEYGPARYGYGPYYDRLRRRRRSDAEIRKEVEDALFYDTWVDADAITVSVQDAVVTLSGLLPTFEELRYAVDDAWDVDGVRGVRSELDVDESGGRARRRERPAGESAGERDAREALDPRQRDPEWRRHLHGHPEAGERPAGAPAQPEPSPRGRGGRGRAPAAGTADETAGRTRGGARAARGRARAGEEPRRGARGRRGTAREGATGTESPPASGRDPGRAEEASPVTTERGTGRSQ